MVPFVGSLLGLPYLALSDQPVIQSNRGTCLRHAEHFRARKGGTSSCFCDHVKMGWASCVRQTATFVQPWDGRRMIQFRTLPWS